MWMERGREGIKGLWRREWRWEIFFDDQEPKDMYDGCSMLFDITGEAMLGIRAFVFLGALFGLCRSCLFARSVGIPGRLLA